MKLIPFGIIAGAACAHSGLFYETDPLKFFTIIIPFIVAIYAFMQFVEKK